jgi:ankyrin repeat protein
MDSITAIVTQTTLHLVVEKGHIENVKLLLEHGADINIKNSNRVQTTKTTNLSN